MRLACLIWLLLAWPALCLADKPTREVVPPRPLPCNLSVVAHDWDFAEGDQGFSTVDCDDGGVSPWEYGPTTLVDGAPGNVWGTVLDADYPDDSGQGLVSPSFVVGPDSDLLEVLHYFDTESQYDGCNVSVGIWPNSTVITPIGGYTVSEISSSPSFYAWCVDAEPGWSGSSGGWVVDCFDLSAFLGEEIQVEFDFGSDVSIHAPGWYLARVTVGGTGPSLGACCDPTTGDCQVTSEDVCLELGGVWHPEFPECDPNPCPPWEPEILAGDWLGAEPWHDYVPYSEADGLPLTLPLPPPLSTEVSYVEFSYLDEESQTWQYLGQDDDGTEPAFQTVGDDPMVGDGWSIIAALPIPLPQPNLEFKAIAHLFSGEQREYTKEYTLDPAPPSLVTTNIDDFMIIHDHVFDLVLEPNGAVIDSVIVFVEAKADTFVKGVPGIDQHLVSDYHCAPATTAECYRYFETAQGDQVLTGGLNDTDLILGLANDMFTDGTGGGTKLFNWISGAESWIKHHGDDYTLRYFTHFDAAGTWNWTEADWKRMRNELERCQDVLIGIAWDGGGGHALTLNSIINQPLPNGRIRVGFMDPWTGQEEWGEVDPSTGRVENLSGAGGGGGGQISVTMVVSPREPMIDWGHDQYVFRGPVPDPPGATPINIPIFAGRYFIRVVVVNDAGHAFRRIGIVDYEPTTGVDNDRDGAPEMLSLSVPRPNPVIRRTTIAYAVPSADRVSLAIYDVAGRRVRSLFAGQADAGIYRAEWDGQDDLGQSVAAGIYYVRLSSSTEQRSQRVVLIR